MKLKTIRLYGKLGSKFGRVHKLAVSSAAEAVRALCILIPGFESHLTNAPGGYAVFYGKDNLDSDRLRHPSGRDEIRIAPVPAGAKQGGIFQIVVGIVLIVAGFFTGGATWGPAMMMAGAAMAVSGAMLMLSPQPKGSAAADSANNRSSYAFNGPVNTEAQGNPVPLLYGELIVGSSVVSGGVYVEDRA